MKYVALDFETGNQSPLSACALGVSVFRDRALTEQWVSLIRPPSCVGAFDWRNIRLHHITEQMVAAAPSFDTVWARMAADIKGSLLVAHNARFDINILYACLKHFHLQIPECRFLCTVTIARRVWPNLINHKLHTVCHALKIPLNHHEAGSDARASGLILQAALTKTGSADAEELAEKTGIYPGSIAETGITSCRSWKRRNRLLFNNK